MPTFTFLFITIFFTFGFYFFGKSICNLFNLNGLILHISLPQFQYISIGISLILIFLYPFVFLGLVNPFFLRIISYLILLCGFVFCFSNFSSFKNNFVKIIKLMKVSFYYKLFIFIIVLYFFLSLSPVTDSDSFAYHLNIGKYILENGNFPFNTYTYSNSLGGIGELLIALSLSVKAEQFGSFINFVGLISLIGIILKFSNNIKINISIVNFLLILSCPILIFLLSSAKPQFFYASLVSLGYAYLIQLNKKNIKKNILKIYLIINLLLIVAINAKINFSLSLLIINIYFFYIFRKQGKICLYFFLIGIVAVSIFILPILLYKSYIYNYHFFHFFINPLPLNIPGFNEYYIWVKNFGHNFPLTLIFPTSPASITNTFGAGFLIYLMIFLKKFENKNKYIFLIIIFFIILTFLGQKTSRFYLEIYFFAIFLFCKFVNIKENFLNNLFKKLILLQSTLVIIILIYGVVNLFPGNLNSNLKHKILLQNADGYSLFNWTNSVLPKKTIFLTNHRSIYFSNQTAIFADFTFSVNFENEKARFYMLEQIKKEKPKFILFYGEINKKNYGNFDFRNCDLNLVYSHDNVGYHATRNPFNSIKKFYNAYIYSINYKLLPDCVVRLN